MSNRSVRARIEDMLEAIATVDDLIGGLDFQTYESLALRGQRRGVERCIEIISEASRHLPESMKVQYPIIPWRHVRDIGNVLRHGYSSVDDLIIWRIATSSLVELRTVLQLMISSLPPDANQ
jgi:uncharacterized protein with HEPN domain